MSELKKQTAPAWRNVLFVILSACMTGFLWRARGSNGWGSFKGMAMVALGLTLCVLAFFPYKKKMNAGIFPFVILLTALTNAGYGTFNSQITGILQSNPPKGEELLTVNINPASAVATMLLLGFGWAPFFCAFIGYYFSDKKRKLLDALVIIAIFYAADYLCRATVSHLLVKVISPVSVDSFAQALVDSGRDLTPYKAYMSHFSDISFGKKIQFGRNYFQLIECISQAMGTLATVIYTRFFIKDKRGAGITLLCDISLGVAITAADLILFVSGGGFRGSITPPEWLTGWSDWEFFTGFLFGLFTALIIVVASKGEITCEEAQTPRRLIPDKKPVRFIWNYGLFSCFTAITALVVPFAIRLTGENDFIFGAKGLEEEALIPFIAPLGALALIYPALKFTKKERADGEYIFAWAKTAFPVYFALVFAIYMLCGDSPLLHGDVNDYDILTYTAAAIFTLCTAAVYVSDKKRSKSA